jgi:peptide/nickel transport system permease protein
MTDSQHTPETALPDAQAQRETHSYSAIVWSQFKKNRGAMVGLALVIFLFLIAIFVPFLANDKPLYLNQQGKISAPLLAHLGWSDITILASAAAFVIWRVLRKKLPVNQRRLALPVGFGFLVIASLVAWLAVDQVHDRTDYRKLAEQDGVSAVFAPVPFSPTETNLAKRRTPPFSGDDHFLGTDNIGRDVLSRLLWSTRVSLAVGFVAQGFAVTIGVILGAIAGYFGRQADFVVMRLVEIFMCFPAFFLILTIVAFFGSNLWLIMAIIGLVGWTQNARFVRGEFLRLRSMEYAMAARGLGFGWMRIVFRHLLPNGVAPVMVNASFGVAAAILVEGGLSFLGFGVPPPTATWGTMLNDGRTNPLAMPWMIILPGFAIFIAVAAYNLVGEGLRDALDPKLRT